MIYFLLFLLAGCSKPANEFSTMSDEVIKKKTGVDLKITPIDEEKN